jgi:serine protease Do
MQAKVAKRQRPLRFIEALAALMVLALVVLIGPASASPLDRAMDKVFTVRSADAEDRFLGSALLWVDGAVAVTNAHVVKDADSVRLIDRHGQDIPANVIARDPVRDVAVLSVPKGRPGLPLAPDPLGLGDEVFALGAPLGVAFSLTEGHISNLARHVDIAAPIRMLQHDAALNPGSSGGPLVDREGRLVGMNTRIADGSRMFVGIAYAIPVGELTRIVPGLIDETLPPFPTLGLTARPVDNPLADTLDIDPQGLLIDAVTPGGLAAKAGLQPGDILVGAGGTKLAEPGDFAFAIDRAGTKGGTSLRILRDGREQVLRLSLVEDMPNVLRSRSVPHSLTPVTVTAYSFAGLGVTLGDTGAVTAVADASPALLAGLTEGDRIRAINGASVDPQTYRLTAPVLLLLEAPGGATRHIRLDPWHAPEGVRPVGGANVLDPDVVVF